MHEENSRSRYSHRAHRVIGISQLNIRIGHVAKISIIYGGGIIAGSSGDKRRLRLLFFPRQRYW